MTNEIEPTQVLQAVRSLYSELPSMVGEKDWDDTIKPTVDQYLSELEQSQINSSGAIQASLKLMQCLSRIPDVREKIRTHLMIQQVEKTTGESIDPEIKSSMVFFRLDNADEESVRRITIKKEGIDGATSYKLSNLYLDRQRLLDALADTASGAVGVLTNPNPFGIIAGVLGVFRALYKAITVDISQQDASVFWGLIQGQADQAAISENSLLDITNDQRQKLGISQLSSDELRSSLSVLEKVKSIKKAPGKSGYFTIVESFRITNNSVS